MHTEKVKTFFSYCTLLPCPKKTQSKSNSFNMKPNFKKKKNHISARMRHYDREVGFTSHTTRIIQLDRKLIFPTSPKKKYH